MPFTIYKLNFTTGLHISVESGSSTLGSSRMSIRSDTLFSALCCECSGDADRLHKLYSLVNRGKLAFSDALPFSGNELYLPKPVVYMYNARKESSSVQKKILKNIEYIPLDMFDCYLKSLKGSNLLLEDLDENFGIKTAGERVALKGSEKSQPYTVAYFRFAEQCGLYIVVYYTDSEALNFLEPLLFSLGLSGVGGKHTSGLGKFDIKREEAPQTIMKLLNNETAEYQMLLGTALPEDNELDTVLSGSWYSLIRRGGFIQSETYSQNQMKKRTIYMLSAGSCLKSRFSGGMFDLSTGGSHPVWRCGKSIFAGISL